MANDYIPRNDGEFNTWFKNLCQYLTVKTTGANPEWNIPKADVDALNDAYIDWYTLYGPCLKPHTRAETAEKDLAKARVKKVIRPFVKQYLHFKPVTDGDRISMGIPVHDTVPTRIGNPVAQATGDLTFPGVHLVEIKNLRPVGGPPPDPRSDYGVKIFYGLTGEPSAKEPFRLSAPPKTGKDLPGSKFTRKKKMLFDFEGESGNTVYFCLRYESPTGGEGPFGPVLSAVIP
jgi:hypothetical protein